MKISLLCKRLILMDDVKGGVFHVKLLDFTFLCQFYSKMTTLNIFQHKKLPFLWLQPGQSSLFLYLLLATVFLLISIDHFMDEKKVDSTKFKTNLTVQAVHTSNNQCISHSVWPENWNCFCEYEKMCLFISIDPYLSHLFHWNYLSLTISQ